ncbi:MAG: S1 RNA-binding domain-containing protein, partial [Chloroflexi bacterium]|nr:S1 RNA-binding domain-containing protein [Chloroflexota bacterium]
VNLIPGKAGMLHISELSDTRVPDVQSVANEGDELDVMVVNVDQNGRVDLSVRARIEENSHGDHGRALEEAVGRRRPNNRGGGRGGDRGGRGGGRFDRDNRGGGRGGYDRGGRRDDFDRGGRRDRRDDYDRGDRRDNYDRGGRRNNRRDDFDDGDGRERRPRRRMITRDRRDR